MTCGRNCSTKLRLQLVDPGVDITSCSRTSASICNLHFAHAVGRHAGLPNVPIQMMSVKPCVFVFPTVSQRLRAEPELVVHQPRLSYRPYHTVKYSSGRRPSLDVTDGYWRDLVSTSTPSGSITKQPSFRLFPFFRRTRRLRRCKHRQIQRARFISTMRAKADMTSRRTSAEQVRSRRQLTSTASTSTMAGERPTHRRLAAGS